MHRFVLLLSISTLFFLPCRSEVGRKDLVIKSREAQEATPRTNLSQLNRIYPLHVVQISWRPRVFLYEGFLSNEECDHMINRAKYRIEELSVGHGKPDNFATRRVLQSSNFLAQHDEVAASINERISTWTFLPKENADPLRVEHYKTEDAQQKFDFFGNRSIVPSRVLPMAVVVIYLSNVAKGGAIVFSNSESSTLSDCSESNDIMKPVKGNAILFFGTNLNASLDTSSFHARCPVVEGEMWAAVRLFWTRSIGSRPNSVEPDDSECVDEDGGCPQWASSGECERNPVYMIGTPDYYGACRKSCNAC